jgi:signal transduction histidine kinase/ActR/RegA family two-component response regulator
LNTAIMTSGADNDQPQFAVVFAPGGRDAEVIVSVLETAGIKACVAENFPDFVTSLDRAAAAIVVEEALMIEDRSPLASWTADQPPWSDFPFILLSFRGEAEARTGQLVDLLGNVTLLERPLRAMALVSSVRAAMRARSRQLQALAYLQECAATEAKLRELTSNLEDRVIERTLQLSAANDRLTAEIVERERTEGFLLQSRKMEAIGQLTGGVAHDFNNLLTVVLGNLAMLEKTLPHEREPALARRLSHMRIAAERGAKLTAQLLAFSRKQRLQPKAIDLNQTIQNMRELLQSSVGATLPIELKLQPGLWRAEVDPTQIELVLLNLAINARDAMTEGGSLNVETSNVKTELPDRPEHPPAGEFVNVTVTDSGTGISEDILGKVFEPFFTTKPVGKGSGLGLSQVLGFAKQSGGGVRIESKEGHGTSVKVYLPRAPETVAEEGSTQAIEWNMPEQRATILLVDDDYGVREVTAAMLRDLGYSVLEADGGKAALELLREHPAIELVLVDYAMPEMNGAEVARRAKAIRPGLPIVFITGYADASALAEIGEERIIRKPFANGDISQKLRAALHQGNGNGLRGSPRGHS